MRGIFAVLGALSGAVVVLTGAFGAHALRETLDPRRLGLWEKAVHWQAAHAAALLLVAVALGMERESPAGRGARRALLASGWLFLAGTLLFSGSLYALALTDAKGLGAVTPVGGVAFLAGWLALAVGAWPRRA